MKPYLASCHKAVGPEQAVLRAYAMRVSYEGEDECKKCEAPPTTS
jgi:hypothetical protein